MLDFDAYIRTLNAVIMPVLIRRNSDITLARAFDILVARVERIADQYAQQNVYVELTDLRTGNQYTVFSHRMMTRYDITDQINQSLDAVAIRQAIVQSQPEAICALVHDALAAIDFDLPSTTEVAQTLANDVDFVDQVRPIWRDKYVRLAVMRQVATLQPRLATVRLSVLKRSIQLSVRSDYAAA